jgi:hypothetical protein
MATIFIKGPDFLLVLVEVIGYLIKPAQASNLKAG